MDVVKSVSYTIFRGTIEYCMATKRYKPHEILNTEKHAEPLGQRPLVRRFAQAQQRIRSAPLRFEVCYIYFFFWNNSNSRK